MLVAVALAVGLMVGLLSGLTGVGGGVLMVPFLYVVYARLGVPAGDATPLAHATSLAVIVPTAIRGLLGFRRSGLVQWKAAIPLACTGAATAAVVAQFATRLPAQGLRLGFGCFLVVVSADMLLRRAVERSATPDYSNRKIATAALLGIPVGALSATLGVGGGLPATVGLHYLLDMPFKMITGTTLAVILFTALAGSVSYLLQPVGPLPFGGVVGHVDLLHGLPLAIGAVVAAPIGVRINQRAPVAVLRKMFGVLLVLVGSKLILENL